MNLPVNLHKTREHWSEALWWNPLFTMQREASQDLQKVLPEQFQPLWELGDGVLTTLQNSTHQLFCQMFNTRQMLMPWFTRHPTEPYIDITETSEGFQVKADLPGVDEKDLDLSIADHALTVKSSQRQAAALKEDENRIRHECCDEPFSRTIALPLEADLDRARAGFDKNVLTVDFPRKALPILRKLAINQPPEIPEPVRRAEMETRIAQVMR